MFLLEKNGSGCGHGVISVNPGIMICALWRRKVSECVHCLISVNPGIFLQIKQKTTDTPNTGQPVSVLRFEPGSNRMHNKGQDNGEFLSCFDEKFVLMLRRNVLPPSSKSRAMNLFPLRAYINFSGLKFDITFTGYNPCTYATGLTFFYSPVNSTCTLIMKTAHSVEKLIKLFCTQ